MSAEHPFYPIIYVRGYAMTGGAIEETTATPYMGFNLGSTKLRQRWSGETERHIFESPLLRLMKDHKYTDAYRDGRQFEDGGDVRARSVFIYRYYEQSSDAFGDGERREIGTYALGLADFILQVRNLLCGEDQGERARFRVYLVAHSMGGLICRCFLQNENLLEFRDHRTTLEVLKTRQQITKARESIDKVFTYATPHKGIDSRVFGNVPSSVGFANANNFNRERMREYLSLSDSSTDDVNSLDGKFPTERFFSLVGTNANDYEINVLGINTRKILDIIGPNSDGLVRIQNAYVDGGPRAYVHRSHSGHYGIVNSEEGYQNLVRFLFGNIRVDGILDVHDVALHPEVQKAREEGKEVRASYHFDTTVTPRGALLWDLHRRRHGNGSAVFRTYDELVGYKNVEKRSPVLFSQFLSSARWAKTKNRREYLGFAVFLNMLIPEYEIERKLWFDDYYHGANIYNGSLEFEVALPRPGSGAWRARWNRNAGTGQSKQRLKDLELERPDVGIFEVPIKTSGKLALDATLQLRCSVWNEE